MPRTKRILSSTGYMHIITRGISRQSIFEEDSDYRFFTSMLAKYSREFDVKVCAYCLMSNHVHILVYDKNRQISTMMHKLNTTYSKYFNDKYNRAGYLFQGRYMNENIESLSYLLIVFRYILNNPQKACIASSSEYKWSSYHYYERIDSWIDTSVIAAQIGNWSNYIEFIDKDNDDECMEYCKTKKDDNWARSVIAKKIKVSDAREIALFDKDKRNKAISILKESGLTGNQIERLTGLSRGIVQRIK